MRYVNDHYRRTGTLWEGRYKACLVDAESYLHRCYHHTELNPGRAYMVCQPCRVSVVKLREQCAGRG